MVPVERVAMKLLKEIWVPVILCIFVVGMILYGIGAMIRGIDEDNKVAWKRFEKRLEKCADVPGRDYEGCMDRQRAYRNVERNR